MERRKAKWLISTIKSTAINNILSITNREIKQIRLNISQAAKPHMESLTNDRQKDSKKMQWIKEGAN